MIEFQIEDTGIVLIEPISSLTSDDFRRLSEAVDARLEEQPAIRGMLIHSKEFPGWENFASLVAHIRFVRDHHAKIERVALVTDSSMGSMIEMLTKHFVSAQVRHFPYADLEVAKDWIESVAEE